MCTRSLRNRSFNVSFDGDSKSSDSNDSSDSKIRYADTDTTSNDEDESRFHTSSSKHLNSINPFFLRPRPQGRKALHYYYLQQKIIRYKKMSDWLSETVQMRSEESNTSVHDQLVQQMITKWILLEKDKTICQYNILDCVCCNKRLTGVTAVPILTEAPELFTCEHRAHIMCFLKLGNSIRENVNTKERREMIASDFKCCQCFGVIRRLASGINDNSVTYWTAADEFIVDPLEELNTEMMDESNENSLLPAVVVLNNVNIENDEKPASSGALDTCTLDSNVMAVIDSFGHCVQPKGGFRRMCPNCDKSYENRSSYKTHVRSHYKNLECPKCSRTFSRQEHMQKHIIAKHKTNDFGNPTRSYAYSAKNNS